MTQIFPCYWIALYEDGVEIARDDHHSQAHKIHSINNIYSFEVKNYKAGAKYTVKVKIDKVRGAKSSGVGKMRLVK